MSAQSAVTVHIDIGYTAQYAAILGEKPSIDHLCGTQTGDSIRDSLTAIQSVGGYPAACTCAKCKQIADLLYRGIGLRSARELSR